MRSLVSTHRIRRDDLASTVAFVVRSRKPALRTGIYRDDDRAYRSAAAQLQRKLAPTSALVVPVIRDDETGSAEPLLLTPAHRTVRSTCRWLNAWRRGLRLRSRPRPMPLPEYDPQLATLVKVAPSGDGGCTRSSTTATESAAGSAATGSRSSAATARTGRRRSPRSSKPRAALPVSDALSTGKSPSCCPTAAPAFRRCRTPRRRGEGPRCTSSSTSSRSTENAVAGVAARRSQGRLKGWSASGREPIRYSEHVSEAAPACTEACSAAASKASSPSGGRCALEAGPRNRLGEDQVSEGGKSW